MILPIIPPVTNTTIGSIEILPQGGGTLPLSKAGDRKRKAKVRLELRVGNTCFCCVFSKLYPDGRLRCNRDIPPAQMIGSCVQPNQSPCAHFT